MGSMGSCYFGQVVSRPKYLLVIFVSIFLLIPAQSFATSGIAAAVANACAPEPTVPDVGSCSACHSTTNNRGPNDLTAAGQWSTSPSTYNLFCPAATTPPPDTTPPPTTPPPTTPPPGSPTPTPTPSMGMGSGASSDDDDDDDDGDSESDDDDGGSGASSSIRSRLRALRSRLRSSSRD